MLFSLWWLVFLVTVYVWNFSLIVIDWIIYKLFCWILCFSFGGWFVGLFLIGGLGSHLKSCIFCCGHVSFCLKFVGIPLYMFVLFEFILLCMLNEGNLSSSVSDSDVNTIWLWVFLLCVVVLHLFDYFLGFCGCVCFECCCVSNLELDILESLSWSTKSGRLLLNESNVMGRCCFCWELLMYYYLCCLFWLLVCVLRIFACCIMVIWCVGCDNFCTVCFIVCLNNVPSHCVNWK